MIKRCRVVRTLTKIVDVDESEITKDGVINWPDVRAVASKKAHAEDVWVEDEQVTILGTL